MSSVFYWRQMKGASGFECVERATMEVVGKVERDHGSYFWSAGMLDSGREPTALKAGRRVMDSIKHDPAKCIFRQITLLADNDQ